MNALDAPNARGASDARDAFEQPLVLGRPSPRALAEQLLRTTWTTPRFFWPLIALSGTVSLLLILGAAYTITTGIGEWGNNVPVAWAFGITNFVFWIGIGHAGTFISAFLLLLKQGWRSSINRVAEAMTLFALINAGMFPVLHLGRPWFAYWLAPYPATMRVWPQFRSALPWDLVAVSTYFTISAVFLYVGLIPDLAKLRDRASSKWARRIYGVMAIGWRGNARQWSYLRIAYGLLAGLATPLVISVHSIVSMDFAIALLPGWHSTVFPPYFVAGALFSGFGMVATILILIRPWLGVGNVITKRHLNAVATMMLITSWMVSYGYFVEYVLAPSSTDPTERFVLLQARPFGQHAVAFWLVLTCNFVLPQALWSKRVRISPLWLFVISITTNVGMWTERFMLIVTSLERDFLPSSWGRFVPSVVDIAMLVGTFGLFATLMMAFIRLFPFVPVHEVQKLASDEASARRAAA